MGALERSGFWRGQFGLEDIQKYFAQKESGATVGPVAEGVVEEISRREGREVSKEDLRTLTVQSGGKAIVKHFTTKQLADVRVALERKRADLESKLASATEKVATADSFAQDAG